MGFALFVVPGWSTVPLRVILYGSHTLKARAVCTAVEPFVCLHAVTYDLTATMLTHRRQLLNCTFETIERVLLISHDDFER